MNFRQNLNSGPQCIDHIEIYPSSTVSDVIDHESLTTSIGAKRTTRSFAARRLVPYATPSPSPHRTHIPVSKSSCARAGSDDDDDVGSASRRTLSSQALPRLFAYESDAEDFYEAGRFSGANVIESVPSICDPRLSGTAPSASSQSVPSSRTDRAKSPRLTHFTSPATADPCSRVDRAKSPMLAGHSASTDRSSSSLFEKAKSPRFAYDSDSPGEDREGSDLEESDVEEEPQQPKDVGRKKQVRFTQANPLVFPSESDAEDGLIPKPQGEVGRPGRGGYTLHKELGWPARQYEKVKKIINKLVEDHLDSERPFSEQPLISVKKVREQAVEKFPVLKQYSQLWVIDDFIRNHLKYRKAIVRKEKLEKLAAEARQTENPRANRNRRRTGHE